VTILEISEESVNEDCIQSIQESRDMTHEFHHDPHGQDEETKWEEKRCTEIHVTKLVEAESGGGK
jgi:hypothetical protein